VEQKTTEQMTDLELATLSQQEAQRALQAQAVLYQTQQNIQIISAEIQKRNMPKPISQIEKFGQPVEGSEKAL
jgi:hypothetical protein